MSDQTPLDVEAIRARLDAATITDGRSIGAIQNGKKELRRHAPADLRRLLDERESLLAHNGVLVTEIRFQAARAEKASTELAARDRTVEALSARLAAKNTELDKTIQGMLNAGAEWAEKIGAVRAERDEAIREAAADKAKLAAKVADLEAQIEAGRRVEKGEPCPECGGTVSPWRDAWGKVGFHACTTCTWPLPSPDGTPRTAPEMPRPPAEEGAMAPDEETEDAIRGQHQTTVRGGNWVSLRCDCREWELEVPAGLDAMPRLKAAHAEHVAEMVAEGARLAAQEPVSGPKTAGTGSGRGTGVAEAPGTAQVDDDV